MADSAANAIQIISPDGKLKTLSQKEDVIDKTTGQLDQPCEAMVWGERVIVSNMDWPAVDDRAILPSHPCLYQVEAYQTIVDSLEITCVTDPQ